MAKRVRNGQVQGLHGPALVWTPQGWQWLPTLLVVLLVYEVVRSTIVHWIKRRYEEQVNRFLRDNEIPTDPFRHTHRVVVKEMVLAEPELVQAMGERADEEGSSIQLVREKVRGWLDEIVPQFNILAYYKVGYSLARMFAYAIYNVRLDGESLERARRKIPEDAAIVYVSNHRSNADFVVTGFMLSKSVQVSYAVGEWARVWPLESIFKSFGSYFVRRGEKDPLYHKTLETYLQLVTKQGVTQAMFPEGGLSRDGALRPVKLGLLDYMSRAKLDDDFTKPLVFVPVGINFDRVFEDETLTREARGEARKPKRNPLQKVARLVTLTGRSLWAVPLNVGRFFTKRLKKHGVCAIHFGEPVVFDDWYASLPEQDRFLDEPERHKRLAELRPFGEDLLRRIGATIPVTPVPLTCMALTQIGRQAMRQGVDRGTILLELRKAVDALQDAGAPFFTGDPYQQREHHRKELQAERRDDLAEVSLELSGTQDLEEILERALDVTAKRRLFWHGGDAYLVDVDKWDMVEYYANSLQSHLQS